MRKAFTLIELMIVIAILGILAALISGNFITSLKKGRDARRKGDMEQIQRALEMYQEDKKAYPATLTFGSSLIDPGGSGKIYMQKIPNDPVTDKDYEYVNDAANNTYKLFACLENEQQLLPYTSTGYSITCGPCKDADGDPVDDCIWGISSSNTTP